MTIAIIKYGMGNVASVQKALHKLGYSSIITNDPDEIRKSAYILLPGVGSFEAGMINLHRLGLVDLLTDEVCIKKKPFFGICLGMQLLATFGNEPHKVKGLGWIEGEVVKLHFSDDRRIPHIGWNNISLANKTNVFLQEFSGLDYYFIHSYHFVPTTNSEIVFTVDYGIPIVAAIKKGNIFATQFHPEKSQEAGASLLKKVIGSHA
ncbi:MAG: Imidazole glycerol phosphate synthase subunit HisH [Microgenomates group bacterium GW2011_GWF1_38_5]|nr:MAG: Imidazole glycerol phosphate synthase subunit HisH [Microgenomates group bacterium GW2011_GWF1_38_5]OGJ15062.1 MAG: imidazole glycerol phosphate synthase, glutamine amidotransferase subunit [Candidatus Nomurabacteria bacterium RIFOXYD1_FULL_39_12]